MRPTQLKLAVKRAMKLRRPLMIHGSPGIGKSDIVDQARKEAGFEHMIDLRLSQLDQVDLRGVPSVLKLQVPNPLYSGKKGSTEPATIEQGTTVWNPPEFLPSLAKTILFLDEINSSSPGVMAAAYELILNRRVGKHHLPEDCAIICAGNLATDFAMVNPMPSALKNRMTHVTLDVNNDDWCEWAIGNNVHESVIAFLRFRPSLLNEFDQGNKTKEAKNKARNMREAMAFATPRTWQIMSEFVTDGIEAEIEYEVYQGIIGEAAAAEFVGFQKYYRSLPNLDQVLMNPKTAKVPTEPATLYALATGLAARATPDNMERVVQYIERIPKEFQVLTVRDCTTRNQDNAFTKAFNNWSVQNADLIS
ncbi:MAG: MoxR family ATPase [Actinomycetota bacterium]|nr:MoxR family ATPase [Actinomycetota bacterium]